KAKGADPACGFKYGKNLFSGLATGESSWSQHRQQRLEDHGKERKELLSMTWHCVEKKPEASGPEGEPCAELHVEALETLTRASTAGPEGGGVHPEQPVDCSGWRVASLDLDGVIKVWSFSPIMQTKASSVSKLPLLSLEWATKWDRLLQFSLDPEPIAINCTAFSHHGNLLATGADDGVIRLFGKQVCSQQSWSPP
ncbi:hypothetical protein HPG69_019389, partial [Diceros bicornis minor]